MRKRFSRVVVCNRVRAITEASRRLQTSTGSKKYKMGYSFKEIREVIDLTQDSLMKEKLKRKIVFRKIGYSLLIATPFFAILQSIFVLAAR